MTRVESVRVAVLDGDGSLLLLRIADRWELPGGGIEAGEDLREAARRGLRDDTGIEVEELGPRAGVVESESGRETIFVLRLDAPPTMPLPPHRWWPRDEPLPRVRVRPSHLPQMLDHVR